MKMLVGSLIEATRRNHALEHATLHVLEEVDASSRLAGRSDWSGFWIYGEVGTGELASAAEEALTRLNDGENRLAIHPRCGTNLVAGLALAGWAYQAAWGKENRPVWRKAVSWMVGLSAALSLAQPLGYRLQQKVTTLADLRGLRIVSVRRYPQVQRPIHFVETSRT